jgi:hypothetical protein
MQGGETSGFYPRGQNLRGHILLTSHKQECNTNHSKSNLDEGILCQFRQRHELVDRQGPGVVLESRTSQLNTFQGDQEPILRP